MEPPGTAPGSDTLIMNVIYRHSRLPDIPNIGGNGYRGKKSLKYNFCYIYAINALYGAPCGGYRFSWVYKSQKEPRAVTTAPVVVGGWQIQNEGII